MSGNYTAIEGLMHLLQYQNNYPAEGTGSYVLAKQAHNLLGPKIPHSMQAYTTGYQINLFGDYPDQRDIAPSIVFAVAFGIIMLLHLGIFLVNSSRGHYFWLSLGWFFYSLMRVIGFAMRPFWGRDLSRIQIGIAGEVFLILPSIFLVSFNLILAQRLFTWRHPVGGSRKLFWGTMITLYVVVSVVVIMTIVASAVPSLYLLSETVYTRYKKVVECTSILVILYSLTSISLLGLSYFFKPTAKDKEIYTYQPWWIESFSPFYFVKRGAAKEAAESFTKRNHYHRHSVRVIAATHHHNVVQGMTHDKKEIKHTFSLTLIIITTLLIFVGQVLRGIVVFQGRYKKDASPIGRPVVMYIFWGLFEVIINLLYIVGRVDLRFYRPDRLPKRIMNIATANQSEQSSFQDSGYGSGSGSDTAGSHRARKFGDEGLDDADDSSDEFGFFEPSSQTSYHPPERPFTAPYPIVEKTDPDSEEEFHF
ncbi:uncharacterized protein RJT20DRAFT_126878 [Scheffersomyces xylosifermentans]|uniref:uncharacterized protein n=1 Tax=Scheffersomyces xylosifermentans TaxID=1304137 RepID=UPI00315DCF06